MKYLFGISSVLLTILFATSATAEPGAVHLPHGFQASCDDPVPGEYIVWFEEGEARVANRTPYASRSVPEVARDIARSFGGRVLGTLDHLGFGGFVARLPAGRARALLLDPRIRYVEQNCYGEMSAGWALDRVDEVFLGTDNQFTYNESGDGVHIYVIDSGIEPHAEFGARLLGGEDFIPSSSKQGDENTDTCGHGTAVASVAAGSTYGVAKGAYLHPLRIAHINHDNTLCLPAAGRAALAIDWVIANNGSDLASVINLSFKLSASSSLEQAISDALGDDITIVTSANNGDTDACTTYPAGYSSSYPILTVGGTRPNDTRYAESNYGSCVKIWAPGEDVPVLSNGKLYPNPTDGTSFAAPLVAGAAAQYLEGDPAAEPFQVKDALLANATAVEIDSTVLGSEKLLMAKPTNACFTWSCSSATKQCTFTRTCTTISGSSASYYWSFGDGTAGYDSRTTFSHQYPSNDIYTVTLTVNPNGPWLNDSDTGCVNTTGVGLIGCMPIDNSD